MKKNKPLASFPFIIEIRYPGAGAYKINNKTIEDIFAGYLSPEFYDENQRKIFSIVGKYSELPLIVDKFTSDSERKSVVILLEKQGYSAAKALYDSNSLKWNRMMSVAQSVIVFEEILTECGAMKEMAEIHEILVNKYRDKKFSLNKKIQLRNRINRLLKTMTKRMK